MRFRERFLVGFRLRFRSAFDARVRYCLQMDCFSSGIRCRHLYLCGNGGVSAVRPDSPRDRAAARTLGAGLVLALVVRAISRLGSVNAPVLDPARLLPIAGVVVALVAVTLVSRRVAIGRLLASRVAVDLVPAEDFDPSPEEVEQLVVGLGRVRPRGGRLVRPAGAVRLEILTDADGLVRMRVSCPGRHWATLEAALAAYSAVELHEPAPDPPAVASRLRRVARTRLVLARPAREALAEAGLQPDLLQGVAAAAAQLDPDRGEQARVVLDVRVLSPGEAGRARRRLLGDRRHGTLVDLLGGDRRTGQRTTGETIERRHETKALDRKLAPEHPLLQFQLALRVEATDRRRALATMRALLGTLDILSGANHLRARGLRLGPLGFAGEGLPGFRNRFDRRLNSGRFVGRKQDVVSARELQGLLKPPTVHCHADNVARSRGAIPAPPRGLPEYHGQSGVIPLGWVQTRTGRRVVGVRASETFFLYKSGRSRYGKTETAIGQFVALVRDGHGGLFMDPHADAIAEIKNYLTDPGVCERVVEIDLSERSADIRQPGWNLFGLTQRTPAEASARVDAFVDALAAALGWDERNTRALNLATQAAQALTELALALPPELAPTIFEVPTLLSDEDWRETVLPRLSPATRSFFTDRFPALPAEAVTAVTNLLDRLRASRSVAALLGSPVSTYDARRAMANDWIVLACPGSGSTRDRLVANLMVYDVLHAAKARAAMPPTARKPFWVFLDELQTYDGPNLPALLEQSAKYGGRAFLFNQNPERLSQATWNAVSTNRSHLLSTAVNATAARRISAEVGTPPAPEAFTRLDAYTYLASVRLGREVSRAFLVHGIPAAELHADHRRPGDVVALDTTIDRTVARRLVDELLSAVDDHGAHIRQHLEAAATKSKPTAPSSSGAHVVRVPGGPS
jgi:hypothetical protein